jgi:membrane-bound lytic murein transglycosylase D
MKCALIVAITLAIILLTQVETQAKEREDETFAALTERIINHNLPTLAFTAPPRCSTRIKKLIIREIVNGKRETEAALGRATLYFPIFEHYLRKYDLPEELKYIPYVETRLKSRALSEVGASGLWQFMPYTAQQYQLRLNKIVDDRYDPLRSTEAAARFLQDLYVEFDDWLLALAAYNCGSGRVQRAIRLSKSRDFWKLEQYLPHQTRNYIPTFIAAVYIGEFHEAHELEPQKYVFNFKNVKILKLRQGVRLSDIAKITDLPITTLRLLNPGYKQGIVPAYNRGNYLILPASTVAVVQRYLSKINTRAAEEVKLHPIGSIAEVQLPDSLLTVPAQPDSEKHWRWFAYAEQMIDSRWLAFIPMRLT